MGKLGKSSFYENIIGLIIYTSKLGGKCAWE